MLDVNQPGIRALSIGIVSGAGPQAGALLYQKIIKKCQSQYLCVNDQDFPEIWISSYPFSPMLQSRDSESYLPRLIQEVEGVLRTLRGLSVNRIGIACNTLHCILPHCENLPPGLVRIPELVRPELIRRKFRRVFILGTDTTIQNSLYDLSSQGEYSSRYPEPAEQFEVSAIILRILAGNLLREDSDNLAKIAQRHASEIDSILLGCTELSVLIDAFPIFVPGIGVVDPLELLASSLIQIK
jgi:aspartate racemase